MADKLRLAWFSPLRGCAADSCSAYFTSMLLPLLRERMEIELFHSAPSEPDSSIFHFLEAGERASKKPFDLHFYQVEDSKDAHFVRMRLGIEPGAVLFHDLALSDRGPEPILESHWRSAVAKYRDPGRALPRRGVKPINPGNPGDREAALAFAAIFTSERNQLEFRRMEGEKLEENGGRSYFLPWPVDPRLSELSVRRGPARRICFCGSPKIQSRAYKLLQALSETADPLELVWLVPAGERELAEDLMREFGVAARTRLVEPRTPDAWSAIVAECDAAVHTLFSMHGHPWPYLAQSMMAGLPCIVTKFGHTELLSDRAVFKIEPGDSEANQLKMILDELLRGDCAAMGALGRQTAIELHSLRTVAEDLASMLEDLAVSLRPAMARWRALAAEAQRLMLEEAAASLGDPDARGVLDPAFRELGWLG